MSRPFACVDYIEFDGKRYMYLEDDNPIAAYQTPEISFVAQPLGDAEFNKAHNVVVVPLIMNGFWDIFLEHPNLISELRQIEKIYDYAFIGQYHYMNRDVFLHLEERGLISNYYCEKNPVNTFGMTKEEKKPEIIKYWKEIAAAKFVFAPRGMGSSSYRLYEAMMVGSVPIITGMLDYPFDNEVGWDFMSIRGGPLFSLIQKSKKLSSQQWDWCSKQAMGFWDEYCRHDKLYEKLDAYLSRT